MLQGLIIQQKLEDTRNAVTVTIAAREGDTDVNSSLILIARPRVGPTGAFVTSLLAVVAWGQLANLRN